MKILIDMNLSPRWVTVLVDAGIASTHWSNVGSAATPDEVIMEFARHGDWVVLTQDLDFGAILAVTHGAKPSVIQIRSEDVSPEAIGAMVIAAIERLREDLVQGALVTVDAQRSRLRYLPLPSRDE